ncbi:hypothetical protein M0R72_06200 [Candidatus Pacearchaeota archaeon]|jgi:hypothetical protein|nr:hypothetical protein [Candidatus Pacearchaeota archaeon]
MISVRVFGVGNIIKKRKQVQTLALRTFTAMRPRVKRTYANIKKWMPTLTTNLQDALVYEEDAGKLHIAIRLLSHGPFGPTDYFPCWEHTHKSISQHTPDEIAHAKKRGAMGIQANPSAISGGKTDIQKDPFVKALAADGFTHIQVLEFGPKGKQRTYDATPPPGWPYLKPFA